MLRGLKQWYRNQVDRDERTIERVFAGRAVLTDDEFYTLHYAESGISKEVALGVRRAFVQYVPLDMRRLAPGDNFGRELQFVWSHDSLADVELILAVEKQFGVSISEAEGRQTATMDALIRLVDAKVRRSPNPRV